MSKCRVLLVDKERSYLAPIGLQFVREYKDQLDIQIITEQSYLVKYLQTPQKIDVLVISEEMWQDTIQKHAIKNIFILKEEIPKAYIEHRGTVIYKYTSPTEVFASINVVLRRLTGSQKKGDCKLIMVYSPQGGSGKTTISLGLAAALSDMGGRVIYLNIEPMQSFGDIVGLSKWADNNMVQELRREAVTEKTLFNNLRLGKPAFLYPLKYSAASSGIAEKNYISLLELIKNCGKFDFAIIDCGSDFTEVTTRLMNKADHVVMPFGQNKNSASKFQALQRVLDISDREKFITVCNGFSTKKINYLQQSEVWNLFQETIEVVDETELSSFERIQTENKFQKLAYSFI